MDPRRRRVARRPGGLRLGRGGAARPARAADRHGQPVGRVRELRGGPGAGDRASHPAAEGDRRTHRRLDREPSPPASRRRAGRVLARRLGGGRAHRPRPLHGAGARACARAPVRQLRPGHRARRLGDPHPGRPRRAARLAGRAGIGHGAHRRARARRIRSRGGARTAPARHGHRGVRSRSRRRRDRRVLLERRPADAGDHGPSAAAADPPPGAPRGRPQAPRALSAQRRVHAGARPAQRLRAALRGDDRERAEPPRRAPGPRRGDGLPDHAPPASAPRRAARSHPEAQRLNARAALATYPVALHRGAARWYEP